MEKIIMYVKSVTFFSWHLSYFSLVFIGKRKLICRTSLFIMVKINIHFFLSQRKNFSWRDKTDRTELNGSHKTIILTFESRVDMKIQPDNLTNKLTFLLFSFSWMVFRTPEKHGGYNLSRLERFRTTHDPMKLEESSRVFLAILFFLEIEQL